MKLIKKLSERQLFIALEFVFFSFLFISCTSKTSEPPANQVYIQNMAFTPSTLTVNVGTTVTWTNRDAITHTVTSDTGAFSSGNVNANGVFNFMFMATGTFTYHCTIHPNMIATIIVK